MSHLFRRKVPRFKAHPWLFTVCFSLCVLSASIYPAPDEDQVNESVVFTKCWDYAAVPDLRVEPVSDETNVYFLNNENKLIAVHLNAGSKIWSAEIGGDVASNLLIAGDSIIVVTNIGGPGSSPKSLLWSLSRETGITEWRTDIPPSASVFLGRSEKAILTLGSDGVVAAFSARGEVIWRAELGSPLSSQPYFDDVGAAVGTTKNDVVAIAGSDGGVKVLWKSKHAPTAVYLNSRTRILVGDERGNLFSLPAGANPSWRFRNGARISRVLSNNTGYLAISDDNFVYNISRSGDVKWKRRLPGRVAGTPLVIADALVLSIVGTGAVYALDLKNGKISNRIETGEESSVGVTGKAESQGFAITGLIRVSYFSRAKCSSK